MYLQFTTLGFWEGSKTKNRMNLGLELERCWVRKIGSGSTNSIREAEAEVSNT